MFNILLDTNDEAAKIRSINRLKDFASVNRYAINMGLSDVNGIIIVDSDKPELEGTSISDMDPELFSRLKSNNYNSTYGNTTSIETQSILYM
nr:hypothetical protein [Brachyspira alvinipulli]